MKKEMRGKNEMDLLRNKILKLNRKITLKIKYVTNGD